MNGVSSARQQPIVAPRLVLREFRADDFDAVHAYGSDPEVVRYLAWGPNTEEDTRDFLERAVREQSDDPRMDYEFAITIRDGGALIGGCGLHRTRPHYTSALMGYCLNRQSWGHGYATEAATALLGFAFDHVGLHRVAASVDVANAASIRVLEKAGMRREAHYREDLWVWDRWCDSYLYAMLEDEWRARS